MPTAVDSVTSLRPVALLRRALPANPSSPAAALPPSALSPPCSPVAAAQPQKRPVRPPPRPPAPKLGNTRTRLRPNQRGPGPVPSAAAISAAAMSAADAALAALRPILRLCTTAPASFLPDASPPLAARAVEACRVLAIEALALGHALALGQLDPADAPDALADFRAGVSVDVLAYASGVSHAGLREGVLGVVRAAGMRDDDAGTWVQFARQMVVGKVGDGDIGQDGADDVWDRFDAISGLVGARCGGEGEVVKPWPWEEEEEEEKAGDGEQEQHVFGGQLVDHGVERQVGLADGTNRPVVVVNPHAALDDKDVGGREMHRSTALGDRDGEVESNNTAIHGDEHSISGGARYTERDGPSAGGQLLTETSDAYVCVCPLGEAIPIVPAMPLGGQLSHRRGAVGDTAVTGVRNLFEDATLSVTGLSAGGATGATALAAGLSKSCNGDRRANLNPTNELASSTELGLRPSGGALEEVDETNATLIQTQIDGHASTDMSPKDHGNAAPIDAHGLVQGTGGEEACSASDCNSARSPIVLAGGNLPGGSESGNTGPTVLYQAGAEDSGSSGVGPRESIESCPIDSSGPQVGERGDCSASSTQPGNEPSIQHVPERAVRLLDMGENCSASTGDLKDAAESRSLAINFKQDDSDASAARASGQQEISSAQFPASTHLPDDISPMRSNSQSVSGFLRDDSSSSNFLSERSKVDSRPGPVERRLSGAESSTGASSRLFHTGSDDETFEACGLFRKHTPGDPVVRRLAADFSSATTPISTQTAAALRRGSNQMRSSRSPSPPGLSKASEPGARSSGIINGPASARALQLAIAEAAERQEEFVSDALVGHSDAVDAKLDGQTQLLRSIQKRQDDFEEVLVEMHVLLSRTPEGGDLSSVTSFLSPTNSVMNTSVAGGSSVGRRRVTSSQTSASGGNRSRRKAITVFTEIGKTLVVPALMVLIGSARRHRKGDSGESDDEM